VASPIPLLAVPNVTAHPSTTSVPITVLVYDGPLLCGFNVVIKEFREVNSVELCVSYVDVIIFCLTARGVATVSHLKRSCTLIVFSQKRLICCALPILLPYV